MKFNQEFEYSFILIAYLIRAGKANLEDVAMNLSMSESVLIDTAQRLEHRGLICNFGEGWELEKEVTIGDVFRVVYPNSVLSIREVGTALPATIEQRTLVYLMMEMSSKMGPLLDAPVRELQDRYIKVEIAALDSLNENSGIN